MEALCFGGSEWSRIGLVMVVMVWSGWDRHRAARIGWSGPAAVLLVLDWTYSIRRDLEGFEWPRIIYIYICHIGVGN